MAPATSQRSATLIRSPLLAVAVGLRRNEQRPHATSSDCLVIGGGAFVVPVVRVGVGLAWLAGYRFVAGSDVSGDGQSLEFFFAPSALRSHLPRCSANAWPWKVSGGNPFQIFSNSQLKVAKEVALPHELTGKGTLKTHVHERIRREIKKAWDDKSAAERALYAESYKDRLDERRHSANTAASAAAAAAGTAGDVAAIACPSSHWGQGSRNYAVHPRLVQQALVAMKHLPDDATVYNRTEFEIEQATQAEEELLGEDLALDGCMWQPRNSCNLNPLHVEIDAICEQGNRLCRRLGVEVARSVDVLVMFEGTELRGPQPGVAVHRIFGLLSMVSYSPQFQVYTLCEPVGDVNVQRPVLTFPLTVRICTGASCLEAYGYTGLLGLSFKHSTSDELAETFVALASSWALRLCDYEMVDAMQMKLVGLKDLPEPERAPAMDSLVRSALLLQQPVSRGRGRSASARGGRGTDARRGRGRGRSAPARSRGSTGRLDASGSVVAAHARPVLHDWVDDQPDETEGPVEADPEGQPHEHVCRALLDVSEGLMIPAVEGGLYDAEDAPSEGDDELAVMHVGPDIDDPSASASSAAPTIDHGVVRDIFRDVDAALAVEGLIPDLAQPSIPTTSGTATAEFSGPAVLAASSASAPAASSHEPMVPPAPIGEAPADIAADSDPLRGWRISEKGGHVFTAENRYVGIITSWGKNISCKCRLDHTSKCTLAKTKAKVSQRDLMLWLHKGQAIQVPPSGPTESHADEHRGMFG